MKLGAIYNVFDGEELLETSINQIREHCDIIIAVVQRVSNYGNVYDGGYKEVQRLFETNKIDFYIEYNPTLLKSGSKNETTKRNLGLEYMKAMECTHFIQLDCDEMYDSTSFECYKDDIDKKGYEGTVCHLNTYYGNANYKLEPRENYLVPFICKLNENTEVGNFNCGHYCDPTRKPNVKCVEVGIIMEHYSYVRKDLSRKIDNSSAKGNISKYKNEILKECAKPKPYMNPCIYKNHKLSYVKDTFDINRLVQLCD